MLIALILEVSQINTSTDWKKTAEKIISLQKKWKSVGSAGPRFENKLWAEFRAACDVFFNARDKHFEEQESSLIGNLTLKNELIATLEKYEVSEDKNVSLSELKNFNERFMAIGQVPNKDKNEVYNRFKKAMDDKYAALKLEASEKETILYKAKIESILASPDRSKQLYQERTEIRKQIDQLNKEIIQMETNLGFFARSKGADQLRLEVERKIAGTKDRIAFYKRKLNLLPNE